ncbi:tigger transposable element-derived protein 1-like [Equus asinus]|uniref:tigger transposable element-derived protein 1-like n=1 Tax=Equus asinus TaxID=9793 RepID=UPI0038F5D4EB
MGRKPRPSTDWMMHTTLTILKLEWKEQCSQDCRENPRAFKHINKHTLPGYCWRNKKSWMTQLLSQDVLLIYYASKIEKYCLENNIPFKILLIVDNEPKHRPFIGNLHPNIKAVFLPPNTTSFIQPMEQGVIAAFKACHLRRTFAQATAANKEDTEAILEELQHT